jgi:lipopolysaccharide export system protein LptA
LATGLPGEPAHFRQKRDLPDEFIEADAERVDYDGGNERVKFIGAARLRVLRQGQVTDEASAAVITYDQRNDTIVFEGGAQISPGAPTGKARLVFQPRNDPANPALAAKPASGGAR